MKIGFIGLGIMGEAMSKNIVKKHEDTVYVFDLEKQKVEALVEVGAIACKDSIELANKSDLIITMVPKSEHSKKLYEEISPVLTNGKIAVDMSTIDPDVSIDIAEKLSALGAQFLDAPVVKSRPAAEAGTLGIYVGGHFDTFKKIEKILGYMGTNILYVGDNGKGLIMKICHNTLVAQIQNGVNETLTLANKNGIHIDDFVTAISYGGGQNFYLDSKAKTIKEVNYTTAFSVENMKKDLDILENLANKSQIALPGAQVSHSIYKKAVEQGYGKEDFSATIKVVRKESLWENIQ